MAEFTIGIDFGGTKMLGAAIESSGTVLTLDRVPTPYQLEELVAAIVALSHKLERTMGASARGLGVGAAGLVDREGGYHFGPNVGQIEAVEMISLLRQAFPGRKVTVVNDNTAACYAEWQLGAGRGCADLVFVGLGTGIGGGIVSRGQLMQGAHGFSAEFGHMTVVANGVACVCGKQGCWEAYASGRAMGRLGREAAASGKAHRLLEIAGAIADVRGEHVTAAAREGDEGARSVLDEFSRWLGLGITNVVALLDPERVIIGGGMSKESELFLPATVAQVDETLFGRGRRPVVPLLAATLGERAGVIGAGLLAARHM